MSEVTTGRVLRPILSHDSSNYSSNDSSNSGFNNSSYYQQPSVKLAGENDKDKMYEPKHNKKVLRVLTVVAYIFFVSFAAIVLSFYYIVIWQPKLSHHIPRSVNVNNTNNTIVSSVVGGVKCRHPL